MEEPGLSLESRRIGEQGGEGIAKIVEDQVAEGELHFDVVPVAQSGLKKGSELDEILLLLDHLVGSQQTQEHPQPFLVALELRPQREKS